MSPAAEAGMTDVARAEKAAERQRQLARRSGTQEARVSESGNEVTLIDDELETLFSRFQKKRVGLAMKNDAEGASTAPGEDTDLTADHGENHWREQDKKAQKLRREERKVRALNRNGRVDYTIQE